MCHVRIRARDDGTPEVREAVRTQIVGHDRTGITEIASELDLSHPTVVRVLQLFAAVGALTPDEPTGPIGTVAVVPICPTARFRDLSSPLW
jgi:hypothetical protein